MRPPEPIFLARRTYRRRRLADAAKVLPVVGTILMLLPVLWAASARTSGGLVYIFGVWAVLIVVVGIVSTRLVRYQPLGEDEPGEAAGDRAPGR